MLSNIKFTLLFASVIVGLFSTIMIPSPANKIVSQQFLHTPNQVIKNLYQQNKTRFSKCDYNMKSNDTHFAQSILIVENALTNPLEKLVENTLIFTFPSVLAYLNISVGPAQIKPMTASKLPFYKEPHINQLQDDCYVIKFIAQWIAHMKNLDPEHTRKRFLLTYKGQGKTDLEFALYAKFIESIYFKVKSDALQNM